MFEGLQKPPAWMSEGLCAGHSMPDLWWYDYPRKEEQEKRKETIVKVSIALEYCQDCPVRKECLEEGLKTENMFGGSIWGGMLFSERDGLLKGKPYTDAYKENWIRKGVASLRKSREKVE